MENLKRKMKNIHIKMIHLLLKMINEINIYIKDKSPLKDLSIILNNSKNINAKEFTKVYLHIMKDDKDETKMDLGQGYQVFDLEKKRIKETHGVIKVE